VALGYLVGGLWLIQPHHHLAHPGRLRGALFASAPVLWACAPKASPRRCSTWPAAAPCSAPSSSSSPTRRTTARGKLLFAAGAGGLTWSSSFGAYPDGVAFATLLMNILVP
jgi:electron transport complex protein RnfD